MLSHGVWQGVKDYDAPSQLINGNPNVQFYKGAIPKGIYYPMCIMNVAFKRKLLPYMYQAPMGKKVGIDRFADIWCGYFSKQVIDQKGWAVVSGYSEVLHKRASNVFDNLEKEARGIGLHEKLVTLSNSDTACGNEYFNMYAEKRKKWEAFICST